MLFPYIFLPSHKIYQLQSWVDELFLDVWCKADPSVDYNIDLLPAEIKEITLEIYYDNKVKTDYFYGPIESVYKAFQQIETERKNTIAQAYRQSNSIEEVCANQTGYNPLSILDLTNDFPEIKDSLEAFFKSLWESVLALKTMEKRIGSINDHYNDFVKINNLGKCPFCGLNGIDGEYVFTREAYDHYLPKGHYPFSSINFKNLAPICNKCNSGNKLQKDPLRDTSGSRRKTFFAYSNSQNRLEIEVQLSKSNIAALVPTDISINIGPASLAEEIDTWKELFGIEARYREKLCSPEAKYWVSQIIDESQNYNRSQQEILQHKLEDATKHPFFDNNFLRKPFLEACRAQRIF